MIKHLKSTPTEICCENTIILWKWRRYWFWTQCSQTPLISIDFKIKACKISDSSELHFRTKYWFTYRETITLQYWFRIGVFSQLCIFSSSPISLFLNPAFYIYCPFFLHSVFCCFSSLFTFLPCCFPLCFCSSSSQLICPQTAIFWQLSDHQKRAHGPELCDAYVCTRTGSYIIFGVNGCSWMKV